MQEEAEGFGAMLDVVVERGVEGAEVFQRDQREDGSSQQCQVFGSFGFAPHAAVFAPAGGVAPPMVFVFHGPMLAADLGQARQTCFSLFKTEDEVPGFLLIRFIALLFKVTGEAGQLPRSGKVARVGIEVGDTQLPIFDAAVGGLHFRGPGGGEVIEFLLSQRVKGGLVVFEG